MNTVNPKSFNINLTGCSGIGKTTLAKALSKEYGIPFVSGSYSDLVPQTKDMPHFAMIQQDARTIFEQDVQVLNARKKLFFEHRDVFVSDRSYIDSAAYMIQKLSHRLPNCEIEDFIEKCLYLTLLQCDKVIYLPYTLEHFSQWHIEDNGKRVLNKFYQTEVSLIIDWLIYEYWQACPVDDIEGNTVLELDSSTGVIAHGRGLPHILVLKEIPHERRMEIIRTFIKRY